MNAPTPADDELLSSYLDGEATPAEVARVEAEPALAARLADLRAARDLTAMPVDPLAATDVDRLIEAAMASSTTSLAVTGIGAARARRSQRVRTIAAVAAAVLLIALAVPVLNAIDLGGGDETADTATSSRDSGGGDDSGDVSPAEDTADEPALEAQAAEAADEAPLDADATRGDGAASDDTVDDGSGGDDRADDDSAAGATTTRPPGGRFLYRIDAVTDDAELRSAVRDEYDDFTAAPEPPTDEDELLEPELALCATAIEVELAGELMAVIDIAVLGVAGTTTVVAVIELVDGDVVLAVTLLDGCRPIELLPF